MDIMSTPETGDKAPAFAAPSDSGETVSLESLKGHNVVLYFYPKDDTPGCTKEACGFRDAMKTLAKQGVKIVGVSKDSVKSHAKFRDRYDLNFPLLSDEDGKICEAYGVWIEKSMYGRKYMGIDRATFLIDEKGVVRHVWRGVKVAGHVEDVAETIGGLRKAA